VSCLLDQHRACANAKQKVWSQSEIWVDYSYWKFWRHSSAVIFQNVTKKIWCWSHYFHIRYSFEITRGQLSAPWPEPDRWCEQMNLNTEKDNYERTVTCLWAYRDLTVSLLWPDWVYCDLTVAYRDLTVSVPWLNCESTLTWVYCDLNVSVPWLNCEPNLTWLSLLWPDCERTVTYLWPYCDLTVSVPWPECERALT